MPITSERLVRIQTGPRILEVKMKLIYELNRECIQRIIAEKFEVLPENVCIEIYEDWVGYGMNEHKESIIRVRVEKEVDNIKSPI